MLSMLMSKKVERLRFVLLYSFIPERLVKDRLVRD